MSKGFNKDGFMAYLEHSFSGFENHFLRETVENLVDYALEHCHHSLDQACYFLSDMLPEVEFSDVVAFMDDSMLTSHAREVKREALADLTLPPPGCLGGTGDLEALVSAARELTPAEIDAGMANLPELQL